MSLKIRNICLIWLSTIVMCATAANAKSTEKEREPGDPKMLTSQKYTEERYEWVSDKVTSNMSITNSIRNSDTKYPSMKVMENRLAEVTAGVSALQGDNTYIDVVDVDSENANAGRQIEIIQDSLVKAPEDVNGTETGDGDKLVTASAVQEKVTTVGTAGSQAKTVDGQHISAQTGVVQVGWRDDQYTSGEWNSLQGRGYMLIVTDDKNPKMHNIEINSENIVTSPEKLAEAHHYELVTANAVNGMMGFAIPPIPEGCKKDPNVHCALITSWDTETNELVGEWHETAQDGGIRMEESI